MHGRLKVKTTAEQQEAKRKEREKKMKMYIGGTIKAFEKRKTGELDEEAAEVTGQLLAANPDFYTLWNIRREIFNQFKEKKTEEELQRSCEKELSFLETCLRMNPKSYGAWHHRSWMMTHMPNPDWDRELKLCNRYLEYDERNFHCWDYRRFVVKHSKVAVQDEFDFTTTKISTNFSNFSSWHYRSQLLPVLHPDPENCVGIKEDKLLEEFELVQNAFFTDPNDQSAWFYHRWLLGRGQAALSMRAVCIANHPNTIYVTFNKATKIGKEYELQLALGDSVVKSDWKSLGDAEYSQLWFCDISSLEEQKMMNVEVSLLSGEAKVSQSCQLSDTNTWWRQTHKPGTLFTSELSASTSTILQAELESCQQLHELEPDNKWTLLTIVSLMRALDPLQYECDTLEYLDKLVGIDPMRTNYYHDLKSKFAVENIIEKCEDFRHFDLSGKSLTSLYHVDHMTLATSLDLSSNCLSSVSGLSLMPSLRTLNLDKNQIRNCDCLQNLDCLEELSLKENSISSLSALDGLRTCRNLRKLHLTGTNPICDTDDWKQAIADFLPNVQLS